MIKIHYPRLFAHRGASFCSPENTLVAFMKAYDLGASWIELDVQLTQDDVLVVFHDETLERTSSGEGLISEKTLSELQNLDVGGWFSPEYIGTSICTLEQVLSMCSNYQINVNIEIKPQPNQAEVVSKLVVELVRDKASGIEVLISSSCLKSLGHFTDTQLPLGLVHDAWSVKELNEARALGCCACHCNHKIVDRERVNFLKGSGFYVGCYTVNERSLATSLFEMGVDGIFSDHPNLLD